MDWSNVLSDAIATYGSIETTKASQPPLYAVGQPGYMRAQMAGGIGGISPLLLIAGAAVVLVVLLKD